MPTLQSWLERGSHVISGWETDTSSQTSASQAGILHGDNSNIPAFRWYDKNKGQVIASSNSKILPSIEKEHSDGNGLLSDNGASRGNLFTGDAKYVMATASAIRDREKFHTSEFQAYFANPYNTSRTLFLFLWDIILEKRQYRAARKNNDKPLLEKDHRGGIYPILRAVMTVLMRELNIYTLIGDVFAGRPSAYATFVGYDEVAHHSGVETHDAFDILRKLDEQFARLRQAADRRFEVYPLSIEYLDSGPQLGDVVTHCQQSIAGPHGVLTEHYMLDGVLVIEEGAESLEPPLGLEYGLVPENRQRALLQEEAAHEQDLFLRNQDGDVRLGMSLAEEDHFEAEVAEVEAEPV
jgi:hypothetical protein